MRKIEDFYTDLVESFGYAVEDGYIYSNAGEPRVQIVAKDSTPIVIPTASHLKSLLNKDTGEVEKIPFNPLKEDFISKVESESFRKCIKAVEARISFSLHYLGVSLLTIASDPKLSKKAKFEVNKFLTSLSAVREKTTVDKEVDANSLKFWSKLSLGGGSEDFVKIINILSKRRGTIGEDKYNRVVTINSPLLDALGEWTKRERINNVPIRPKDKEVFSLLIKFILKDMDKENVIRSASNDETRPNFMALIQLFIVVAERINKLAEMLKTVDTEAYDCALIPLKISIEDLDFKDLEGQIKVIPDEKSLKLDAVKLAEEDEEEEESKLAKLNKANAKKPSTVADLAKKEEDSEDDLVNLIKSRYSPSRGRDDRYRDEPRDNRYRDDYRDDRRYPNDRDDRYRPRENDRYRDDRYRDDVYRDERRDDRYDGPKYSRNSRYEREEPAPRKRDLVKEFRDNQSRTLVNTGRRGSYRF